jgi:uncharacterized protein (DUF1697 family)
MATHVALLRGINVGGRTLPMADLRDAVGSLGYDGVSTYIQSGNVLFSTAETDATGLEEAIAGVIAGSFGLKVGVVVLRRDQLAAVISHNPYPQEANPKYLHAVFLGAEPEPTWLDRLRAAARGRDSLTADGRVVYLHTPDGFGTSELAKAISRGPGTARNWATTTKLLELCGTR